jgi:hypothetical protein
MPVLASAWQFEETHGNRHDKKDSGNLRSPYKVTVDFCD